MPNGMYGGVRGRKTKVGRKLLRFPPTRLSVPEAPGRSGREAVIRVKPVGEIGDRGL